MGGWNCFGCGGGGAKIAKSPPASNVMVQDTDGSSKKEKKEQSQLKDLQIKYNNAKKVKNDLSIENGRFRSQIGDLMGEIQQKDAHIRDVTQAIQRKDGLLNSISDNLRLLEQKLSPRQQQHIHSHDQPMIAVLTACLARFDKLERERERVSVEHQEERESTSEQHQKEIDSLNQSYGHQIAQLREDHEIKMVQQESRYTGEIRELQDEHDNEVQALKGGFFERETSLNAEISRLEVGLLTTVDNFRPIPDQQLVKKLTDLNVATGKFAKEWSKKDPMRVGELWKRSTFIETAMDEHHKFLIQNILWESLTDGFFATPFRIFGQSGDRVYKIWHSLFGKESGVRAPGSEWPRLDKASEKWRSVTFETMQNKIESRAVASSGDETKQDYLSNLSRVEDAIFTALNLDSPYDRPQAVVLSIREMIKLANELAVDFGTQRCRLELFIPQTDQEVNQDKSKYLDKNNEHPDLARGIIKLIVAPGLRRTGDGRGLNYRETAGLCPASVYLKPTD